MKINVAIIGYGNIGKAVEQAVLAAQDMDLVGIYHHGDDLSKVKADVAVLCTPSREVPRYAEEFLARGICTVDSFDIHTRIADLRAELMPTAKTQRAVSIIAAGWDPGTDSVVRALMMAMAPKGLTYTNFGPGRSMGHSVAVKAIAGVKDALSVTIPVGTGLHRRMVYVQLEEGADFAAVEQAILHDDYFVHDETHVVAVASVDELNNVGHGVNLVRTGVSGSTHNQRFEFNMSINNPALTGQILTSCTRAVVRLKNEERFGAYTLIEVPPIYLLPGDEDALVRSLV